MIDSEEMSEVTPVISRISDKVDQLHERLMRLSEEKKALEKTIGELSNQLDQKQSEITSLTEENGKLKLAGSLAGEGENKTEMKLKINELVREIDKCIALLNA